MQVSRWGNSLAVRLPKRLVEALKLREGDQLDVVAAGAGAIAVERREIDAAALDARFSRLAVPAPAGYRFDRDEANER